MPAIAAYDANSQLLASRDDNGSTTAYIYDDQGRTRQELTGQSTGYQQTTFAIPGGDSGTFNVGLHGGVPVAPQATSLTERSGVWNWGGRNERYGFGVMAAVHRPDKPVC
jgi:YD repeat-containing protein